MRLSKSCGYSLHAIASEISYSSKMIWGQVSVLVGLTCFGAVALLMMHRKPGA
jgi:hypothetical protein